MKHNCKCGNPAKVGKVPPDNEDMCKCCYYITRGKLKTLELVGVPVDENLELALKERENERRTV